MSKRMKQALEYFLIFIWAMLTIAVCAGVWNFVPEVTIIIAAVLLFGFNIVAMRKAVKVISKLDKEE